ncbi:MAG: FtsX-like permease family protein [Pseudomonadota bacterium]
MIRLFRLLGFRHIVREPFRSLVSVLAVALGAAVYFSVAAAVNSSTTAFSQTIDSLAGKAQLQVVSSAGGGLDARLFARVRALPGVAAATPVVEAVAQPVGHVSEALLILGVDLLTDGRFRTFTVAAGGDQYTFLNEPDSVAVSAGFAAGHGLRPGSPLVLVVNGRKERLVVRALLRPQGAARALAGNFALMDFGAAQMLFGKEGRLDRIDLLISPGVSSVEVAKGRLSRLLPPGLLVERPRERGADMEAMLAAYRLNLTALALVAFFVSMFLVYSAVSLSAARRRREVGILRSLGAGRGLVLLLFLGEGVALGVAGGLVGILLGVLLARVALASVSETISSIFLLVEAHRVDAGLTTVVATLALSLLVALAASVLPAIEAASVTPREVLAGRHLEHRAGAGPGLPALLGLALLAASAGLAFQPPVFGRPLAGFAAAFVMLLGFALFTPLIVAAVSRLAQPLARAFGYEGYLGARYLRSSLSRTGIALAALASALAMLVSVQVLVLSFRGTVESWVKESMGGDLFVSSAFVPSARFEQYLPPEVSAYARSLPGVTDIYGQRDTRIIFEGRPLVVRAGDVAVLARHGGLEFAQGDPTVLSRLGDRVLISEALAASSGACPGGTLRLPTPRGTRTFRVAGVIYDYHTEGGMVLLDLATFHRWWGNDGRLNSVRLFLAAPSRIEDVRRALLRPFASRYSLFVVSAAELRGRVMAVFDQTFAITKALQLIALCVAAMGVISTFGMLVLERQRDLALLRAVGASRLQLAGMTLCEAWLGSMTSYGLGMVSGTCLSALLIFVINRQSFGWTVRYLFLPSVYAQAAVLVMATSLAAALLPAVSAARVRVLKAMKVE